MLWTSNNNFSLTLCLLIGVASARLSSNISTSDKNDASRALLNIPEDIPDELKEEFCLMYILSHTDEELFELGHSINDTPKIGQHCYVQDRTGKSGACTYYGKGRPRFDDNGYWTDGVPISPDNGGTGCVLGGRNSFCYMNTLNILTAEEKKSMCTDDYKKNAGAHLRWAVVNGYCMDEGVPFDCEPPSCEDLYLSKTDEELANLALTGKIGQHCYIEDNTHNYWGFCEYYAKGRGNVGLPSVRGTGCVKGERNRNCFKNWISDSTNAKRESLCTDNILQNAVADIRWGIENGYCMDEGSSLTC